MSAPFRNITSYKAEDLATFTLHKLPAPLADCRTLTVDCIGTALSLKSEKKNTVRRYLTILKITHRLTFFFLTHFGIHNWKHISVLAAYWKFTVDFNLASTEVIQDFVIL